MICDETILKILTLGYIPEDININDILVYQLENDDIADNPKLTEIINKHIRTNYQRFKTKDK